MNRKQASILSTWHPLKNALASSIGRRDQISALRMLFREMFYLLGASVPNFDRNEGYLIGELSKLCRRPKNLSCLVWWHVWLEMVFTFPRQICDIVSP